jgi:glycerophosphoryl diester phosphodiesterase
VIARGGASAEAPEHTIAAFELAIAEGADVLHLVVHLSRDGHPVVTDDFRLDRTTDGTGPVRDRTVRELKRLDAGAWRGRRFRGQRLQTLQEVLERYRETARFWVELAAAADVYPEIEERVLSTLEIYDVVARAVLACRDLAAIGRLREMSSDAQLGLVLGSVNAFALPAPEERAGLCAVWMPVAVASEATIATVRAAGLACHVGTVNEPNLVDRLASWSADGLVTDRPALVRSRLGR